MDNKQDKGFTLVELLIVIVILGILATVTVFAVRGITDRGQENACAVDSRTLDTSIEAFYAQYQRDPASLAELTTGVGTDEPILKEAPSNFEFVGRESAVAPIWAADSYVYTADSWGNSTAADVTVTNADSAVFFPTTTGDCHVS